MARKSVEIIEKEIEVEEARYIIHLMSNKMAEATLQSFHYIGPYSGDVEIYDSVETISTLRILECHGGEYIFTDKIVKMVKADSKKVKKTIKIKKTMEKQIVGPSLALYSEVKNA